MSSSHPRHDVPSHRRRLLGYNKEILAGHGSVRIIARRERAVYPNDDNAPRRVQLADIGVGMHLARAWESAGMSCVGTSGYACDSACGMWSAKLECPRVGGRCPHRAPQQAGTHARLGVAGRVEARARAGGWDLPFSPQVTVGDRKLNQGESGKSTVLLCTPRLCYVI